MYKNVKSEGVNVAVLDKDLKNQCTNPMKRDDNRHVKGQCKERRVCMV